MPHVLWIWDVLTLSLLAVLIQQHPIKSFDWRGDGNDIVVCTGSNSIFQWSASGASVCRMPFQGQTFCVEKAQWGSDSASILLFDKKNSGLVIAYPEGDEESEMENSVQMS